MRKSEELPLLPILATGTWYQHRFPLVAWYSQKRLKSVLREVKTSETILDVGCGRGILLPALSKRAAFVVGIDLNKDLVKLNTTLHSFNFHNIGVVVGDACYLPFKDNTFSLVTCVSVLEHIKELKRAINELNRVVKREVIVGVPSENVLYKLCRKILGFRDPGHHYSGRKILQVLKNVMTLTMLKKIISVITASILHSYIRSSQK